MLKPKIILRSNLNFAGMALWPFIFLHRDHAENETLLNPRVDTHTPTIGIAHCAIFFNLYFAL